MRICSVLYTVEITGLLLRAAFGEDKLQLREGLHKNRLTVFETRQTSSLLHQIIVPRLVSRSILRSIRYRELPTVHK